MQAVSERFLALLRVSHVVALEVQMTMPEDELPMPCPLMGGELVMDRTALVRRTGRITIPATAHEHEFDLRMLPFGSYVDVKRGVRFGSGERELVQLGHLRCEAVATNVVESTASVDLADRMAQVEDEEFRRPVNVSGQKPSTAAVSLVSAIFGSSITYTDLTNPAAQPTLVDVIYEQGRAEAVADLARSIGASAYFDPFGDFVIAPLPSVADMPVWAIDGGASGVLSDMDEAVDRTDTVNGILMRGQANASAPPFEVLVIDNAPESPLRWGGPFGRVARIEQSTAVITPAQAASAAQALLDSQLGLSRTLTLASVPNPALLPGDVVEVVLPDQEPEYHFVDALRMPLDATGSMGLATRTLYSGEMLARKREELWTRKTFYGRAAWRELRGAEAIA